MLNTRHNALQSSTECYAGSSNTILSREGPLKERTGGSAIPQSTAMADESAPYLRQRTRSARRPETIALSCVASFRAPHTACSLALGGQWQLWAQLEVWRDVDCRPTKGPPACSVNFGKLFSRLSAAKPLNDFPIIFLLSQMRGRVPSFHLVFFFTHTVTRFNRFRWRRRARNDIVSNGSTGQ